MLKAEELLLGVDGIELPTEQDEFNAKIREQLPQQIADIKQRIQEIYDTYFNDDGVQIRLVPRAIINRLNRDIRMTVAMGKRLGLKVDLNEITGVNVAEGRITSFIRAIGEMLRPREY